MSDIKALEDLRELCASVKSMDFASVGCDAVLEIADRINDEIAERYIELPVDADGVLIHVGDVVQGHGDVGPVQHIELWDGGWVVVFEYAPGQFTRYSDDAVYHYKRRTLEDVLEEAVGELFNADISTGSSEWDEVIAKYADEIREMMA